MKSKVFNLLSIAFCLFLSINAFAYDTEINGIYYEIDSDTNHAYVTYRDKNYNSYSGNVVIPSSIYYNGKNYLVYTIYPMAFYGCSGLTSVTIPNSVVGIGTNAFEGCTSMTSVTIPNSVTEIKEKTFYNCTNLTSITIGYGLNRIGYAAFSGCSSLTDVHITDLAAWCNISSYYSPFPAHHLYLNNQEITDLVIPDGVRTISKYAFSHCSYLTSVTIPNSVTSIGDETFKGCSGLTSIIVGAGNTNMIHAIIAMQLLKQHQIL